MMTEMTLGRLPEENEDGSITLSAERYAHIGTVRDSTGRPFPLVVGPIRTSTDGVIDPEGLSFLGTILSVRVVPAIRFGD